MARKTRVTPPSRSRWLRWEQQMSRACALRSIRLAGTLIEVAHLAAEHSSQRASMSPDAEVRERA